MSDVDIFNFLTSTKTPLGFILTWVMLFALLSGTFSTAAERYGGVFGKLSRALKRQKTEAIAEDQRSIERKVNRLEKAVERLDREVAGLSELNEVYHDYSLYVLRYSRALEEWSVSQKVELPRPPMLSFTEFKNAVETGEVIPTFNFLDGD